jgi:hypothetical protein
MARDEMRAADTDRQVVADRLRAALDEGRLDLHEYDERLQRAYAAKTYGELNGLLTDLPSTVPPAHSQVVPVTAQEPVVGASRAAHPDATRRWLVETWNSYGAVVGITIAVWLISSIAAGDLRNFWPIWVAGPWGAILLWHTVTGLSTGEPQRWAEKQDRKRAKKQLGREQTAARDGEPPVETERRTAS